MQLPAMWPSNDHPHAVSDGQRSRQKYVIALFRQHGFEIVGLFDADPAKVGTTVDGLTHRVLFDFG